MTEPVADPGRDSAAPGPPTGGPAPALIAVRITIHMTDDTGTPYRPGDEVLVDPAWPGIPDMLRAQFMVPLPAHEQPSAHAVSREGT